MIKGVNLGQELVVTEKNKAGILADITKLLADHGINIEGMAGYVINDEAKLMFITNDNARAKDALSKKGYKSIKEHEVIMVDLENKPGALKIMAAKMLADKIDIKYLYATTCGCECPARIVFAASDNEKAVVALKK